MVSSGILLIEFLSMLVFEYHHLVSNLVDDLYPNEINKVSLTNANIALFFFTGSLLVILMFVKKRDYHFLTPGNWSVFKGIGMGVLIAYLLRTIYSVFERTGGSSIGISTVSSIQDYFASINEYYHPTLSFLFMVVIVPFYEEYLFRGIALVSMERKIKFLGANVLQAAFFALLHEDLSLFLFYFSFAMVAGYLVRQSGSILPSIVFHCTNNFLAFIAFSKLV